MVILLTGCINPNGMILTSLNDKEIRKQQYVDAIKFYLNNTKYPIVFTENSNTNINYLFPDDIKSGRMECLTFPGNQNKERGKGFGECEIIQYALTHSTLIRSHRAQRIAKITGRLIVRNIQDIIRWHTTFSSRQTTFCAINSDLSFPDSRFIIAAEEFYQTFLKRKDFVNDQEGYYFEHALCDTIKNENQFNYSPFFIMPQIEGISGSTGIAYTSKKQTLSTAYRYARFGLSLRYRFNKQYR